MRLLNGTHGYGAITKVLHWLTVFAFVVQFYVGYTMESHEDIHEVDCDQAGEDRRGGDTSDATEERLDRLEEQCEAAQEHHEEAAEDAVGSAWSEFTSGGVLDDGFSFPELHVLLGLTLIALAVLRTLWRTSTPLPPWDKRLSPTDQRVVHATETVLLTLQFVVPLTGIVLVAFNHDLLWLHIAGHIAFFAALAVHLAMVLGKGLLRRMLPGG